MLIRELLVYLVLEFFVGNITKAQDKKYEAKNSGSSIPNHCLYSCMIPEESVNQNYISVNVNLAFGYFYQLHDEHHQKTGNGYKIS